MGWKATGAPVVRRQRDRWVVRVDGIDTETGKHRPRQLGTYASKRSARGRGASCDRRRPGRCRARDGELGGALVGGVENGSEPEGARAVRVGGAAHRGWARRDHARPARPRRCGTLAVGPRGRADAWADGASRSVAPCCARRYATPSRKGVSMRNPAARVPMPRQIAKPTRDRVADAWSEDEVAQFLADASADHRWAAGFRHRCAVRAPAQRAARPAVGRSRHRRQERSGSTRAWCSSVTASPGRTPRAVARSGSSRSIETPWRRSLAVAGSRLRSGSSPVPGGPTSISSSRTPRAAPCSRGTSITRCAW